jgi:uncharacterized protein YjbI with pentapeptide repeats
LSIDDKEEEDNEKLIPLMHTSGNALTLMNALQLPLNARDLRQVRVYGADLSNCCLTETNFDGSLLHAVDLSNSDLRRTNFFMADLQGTIF